jgi:ribonuclease Y
MDQNIIFIGAGAALLGLILGLVISKIRENNNASKITRNAKRSAKDIISKAKSEGENIKKDKIFQAKERFLELKSEHEKVILSRDKKWQKPKRELEIKNHKFLQNSQKIKN